MNNTSIIVEQSPNFQFLSVCHYITLLGTFFHNTNFITFEQQSQPDIVVNTLIEYLTIAKNETRSKHFLLSTILKGTDLYGGEKGEKLDKKYVNETFKYFINGVLFPNYSNINLYLAEMIQNSDNLNYSIFKKTVYNHLLQHHFNWEYCSQKNYTSTLPQLTIKKIFDEYIWSIFPQPEEDMSIMDVKYMYSMVGLNILRSTSLDEPNLSFSEYILISRELDLQHIDNETYKIVLQYYSTAALFFYASKGKGINKINLNDEFWRQAYKILFTEIDIKMNEIVSKEIENSLPYKLERQINNTKTRTMIAREILLLYCFPSVHGVYIETLVYLYKTLYLWTLKSVLQRDCKTSHFPDLNNVFFKQFPKIEKLYKEIIRNSISNVLIDGGLLEKMNPNVTVNSAKLIFPMKCYDDCNIDLKINEDIHVIFAIIKNKKKEYYAIRQVKDELTLITRNGNEKEFLSAITNPKYLKLVTSVKENLLEQSTYKYKNENYKFFVERIANMKTKLFITNMTEEYYEETLDEKISNIVKIFIPLYNCIESSIAGDISGATLSCSLDILSFMPIIGLFASTSFKIVNSVGGSIVKNIYIANAVAKTAGIVTKMSLTAALKAITKDSVITIAKQILTKEFSKALTIASLRTLDPGFELLYSMGRFSFKMLGKLVKNFELIFKTISQAKNFILSLKTLLMNMQRNMHLLTDIRGLVPKVLLKKNNYDIVRYHYPGGSHLFGPECIRSIDTIAELRTVQGASYKLPVVPVKSPGEIFYKQFVPETGDIIGPNLKMDKNDLLLRVKFMVADMVANGPEMKITRDYHVYHNTIEWKIKPSKEYNGKLVLIKVPHPLPETSNALEKISNNVHSKNENAPVNLNQQLSTLENNSPQLPNLHPHPLSVTTNVLEEVDYITSMLKEGDISNSFEFSTVQMQRLQEFLDNIPGTSRQTLQIKPKVNIEKVEIIPEGYDHSSQYVKQILEGLKENQNLNPNKRKLDTMSEIKENIASHQHETQDLLDNIPGTSRQNVQQNPNLSKEKVNTVSEGLENTLQREKMQTLVFTSGTSIKRFKNNPKYYKAVLKVAKYKEYVNLLKLWRNNGLKFMMTKENEIYNFRHALNSLAHLQLNHGYPLRIPRKLYHTQIMDGVENVDLLINLKTKDFFFNDITILTYKKSMPLLQLKDSEIQVQYSLTINSPYGIVDLTHIHEDFVSDYITFGDVVFTVKDSSFIESNKILNIQLEQKKMSLSHWFQFLENDLKELLQMEKNLKLPRVSDIENHASILSNSRPLTSLKSAKRKLEEYILSIKPSLNVPSYNEFANEILSGKFTHYYEDWKIAFHPYIQDLLLKSHLDNIFAESHAERRIQEIYGLTYSQDISTAFSKYNKIKDIRQHLRFEDYYILYSYTKRKSLLNIDGQRRMDAAINRLALRQSDTDRVDLMFHRAEIISEDYASYLLSLGKKKFITFEENIMLYPDREMELDNCLKMTRTSNQMPLIMDIRLKNAAGLADVTSVISDETHPFYVMTSRSEFILEDNVYIDTIEGVEVLIMKIEDGGSPTEKRMVNIAKNLQELFSTNTKFYSEFGN
ncbi:uncharacterized protein LOC127278099 [Leptopilina boulardi]|uniref:uncharacterized protein LOC127278099 n=1 Tax=Leptopilina boulardi TaxID=63433 RepID=UPI0021F58463|nr:uncharacterized protein LOC127278099 [Leptopilina boulardi]